MHWHSVVVYTIWNVFFTQCGSVCYMECIVYPVCKTRAWVYNYNTCIFLQYFQKVLYLYMSVWLGFFTICISWKKIKKCYNKAIDGFLSYYLVVCVNILVNENNCTPCRVVILVYLIDVGTRCIHKWHNGNKEASNWHNSDKTRANNTICYIEPL